MPYHVIYRVANADREFVRTGEVTMYLVTDVDLDEFKKMSTRMQDAHTLAEFPITPAFNQKHQANLADMLRNYLDRHDAVNATARALTEPSACSSSRNEVTAR